MAGVAWRPFRLQAHIIGSSRPDVGDPGMDPHPAQPEVIPHPDGAVSGEAPAFSGTKDELITHAPFPLQPMVEVCHGTIARRKEFPLNTPRCGT